MEKEIHPTLRIAEQVVEENGTDPDRLVKILQEIQKVSGCVSLEAQSFVADKLKLPVSRVFGIVSFYNFFKLEPPGRHEIHVCMGTACYVRGAKKLVEKIKRDYGITPGETTSDQRFSLEEVRCIGCCAIGPVITVDGKEYGGMSPEKLNSVLSQYK
ncbi:MAG: hypothetical protein BA874_10910 [Desulfuromonadales bacterium C00003068]|nr:MAG: hypothetical protein BA874_10910 [Desulfuromonadales bacterium C00003068]